VLNWTRMRRCEVRACRVASMFRYDAEAGRTSVLRCQTGKRRRCSCTAQLGRSTNAVTLQRVCSVKQRVHGGRKPAPQWAHMHTHKAGLVRWVRSESPVETGCSGSRSSCAAAHHSR
jgi:hypothetical protein